ncbi:MAG: hypothetical protein Q9216_005644 [Gyalolechia sp. 2 TL-2023]
MNQGPITFVPVSAGETLWYRRVSDDNEQLDKYKVFPPGSVTLLKPHPRTVGHGLSSWRNNSQQDFHPYQNPGVTLTRPLAPKVYDHQTSTGDIDLASVFEQPGEVTEAVVESNDTAPMSMAPSHHTFNMKMHPTSKKKRRTFSDAEKERIKHVRKHGACLECRNKKRKCIHVPVLPNDRPSPQSPDSVDSEPATPDPVTSSSPIRFSPEIDFVDFLNEGFRDAM